MKKEVIKKLIARSKELAKSFSNPERTNNINKEVFAVEKIIPLSETTAVTIFKKNTNKKAIAVFIYINSGEGYWISFFPTYDTILGLTKIYDYINYIEQHNFNIEKQDI